MSIRIRITDPINSIQKKINKAFIDTINEYVSTHIDQISNSVKSLIPSWIQAQPEITSLLSTESVSLAGQFGIYSNANSIVNTIIQSVLNSTEVKFIKYRPNFQGGLELRVQPSSFQNLLSLSEGHVLYSGGDLHWLEWLIKRGDSIIVVGYQYNPQTGLGRSGLGNMIPGNSFRIPPQFSGTLEDNFITRALIGEKQEQQIFSILEKFLK